MPKLCQCIAFVCRLEADALPRAVPFLVECGDADVAEKLHHMLIEDHVITESKDKECALFIVDELSCDLLIQAMFAAVVWDKVTTLTVTDEYRLAADEAEQLVAEAAEMDREVFGEGLYPATERSDELMDACRKMGKPSALEQFEASRADLLHHAGVTHDLLTRSINDGR